MEVTKKKLSLAVEENIITSEQADYLYTFLEYQSKDDVKFSFTHVLYYFGGLIAIGAMTLFMGLGWETFGGAGIFFISILYAAVGLKLTNSFAQKNLVIPAGISATFVVCLSPLAIYGYQQWFGFWPEDSVYQDYHRYVQWNWLYMELGTLAVGSIVAWKYKYPFLIMPIAVTLWYLSMDITAIISGGDFSWTLRKLVSLYSGLLMIGLAFWIDIRSRYQADYAFWIYIFGVIAFWGGMTFQESDNELSKFLYFCINLMMICIGAVLVRRVFVVFGAIGCCIYITHLTFEIFADSWLFPIALTAIGLGIVYLGILWQKHEKNIVTKLRKLLPIPVKELLESKE